MAINASPLDDSEPFALNQLQVIKNKGASIKSDRHNIAKNVRAYRRRIAAAGEQEVLFRVSNHTVEVIDELKKRLGLRNRGQVLEQLFQQGRETTEHYTT